MEAFFRGSHTTNFVTWGFNKSYNQAAEVPSSNVTRKSPCSPSITCRIMLAFVSMTHSITTFPAPFLTAIETLSLCTSMPIYLVLVIKGCSFLKGLSQALKTYSKRGALYIASRNGRYKAVLHSFQRARIITSSATTTLAYCPSIVCESISLGRSCELLDCKTPFHL